MIQAKGCILAARNQGVAKERVSPAKTLSIRMPRQTFFLGTRRKQLFGLVCLSLFLCDCGGGGSSSPPSPPPPPTITSVTVTAAGTTILTTQTLVFTAKVQGTGNYSSAVTWEVNGIPGGNAQNGTINDGTYVAPTTLPSTDPITVTATSVSDPTKSGSATATVFSIVIAPANPTLSYGQTQQFSATVTGLNNPVIQWSAVLGTINSSGLYSAPSQGTVSAQDTVSASATGATGSVSTNVNLQPVAPTLTSVASELSDRVSELSAKVYITSQTYSFHCQAEFQSLQHSLLFRQLRSRQRYQWALLRAPLSCNTPLPAEGALRRTASILLVCQTFTFAHKILNYRLAKQRNSIGAYWEEAQVKQSHGRLTRERSVRAANIRLQRFLPRDLRQSQPVSQGRKLAIQ